MIMTVRVSILVTRGCAWRLQLLLVMPNLQRINPQKDQEEVANDDCQCSRQFEELADEKPDVEL